MKHNIFKKVFNIIRIAVGIILSWGGILYAINDPDHFKIIGIIVSLLGYGVFFWAVHIYETDSE